MGLKLGNVNIPNVKALGNSGDYTVDEVATKSVPIGDIVVNSTKIAAGTFRGNTALTGISSDTVTNVYGSAFYNCTNLEYINLPNLRNTNGVGSGLGSAIQGSTFRYCTKITSLNFPLCTTYNNNLSNEFSNNNNLEELNIPLLRRLGSGAFNSNPKLSYLVLPGIEMMQSASVQSTGILGADFSRISSFPNENFKNSNNLSILVLRKASVITISNINVFTGTPFASGGTGGILYVPEDLISSYEAATNWSIILGYENNQIKKIEDTTYETHYVDGTLMPTYTNVNFTRIDGRNYDDTGGWASTGGYFSTDFISKNDCNEWDFCCNANPTSYSSSVKVQEFYNNEFIGVGSVIVYPDKTISNETLYTYKFVLHSNSNKFRFSLRPTSEIDKKSCYLQKVTRHFGEN